jgi:hypothetical protein
MGLTRTSLHGWMFGLMVATLAIGGCDAAFGLQTREAAPDAAPDAPPYSPCGAFLYDEPLRYANISNPRVAADEVTPLPWSWDDARTMCLQRGMDLAVFNDEHELGMAPEAPAWPFWIGEKLTNTTWSSVDDCPALEPATPPAMSNGCGVVNGPITLGATACTGQLAPLSEPPVVTSALCETPRPTSASCLGNDPLGTRYVRSIQPLSHEGATAFCDNVKGQLVVFETHAEWKRVSKLTNEQFKARFWVGSTFDGTTWNAITSCPATYSWQGGTPGTPAAGSCLSTTLRVFGVDNGEHQGIWLDGVTPTTCDRTDELFAVCEIR